MSKSSNRIQIWDRQFGETTKSFEAFLIYRDLPKKERSLAKAAEIVGKADSQLERWSSKYRWVERVAQYDEHKRQEEERRNASTKREGQVLMTDRHTSVSVLVQNRIVESFQKMTVEDWVKIPVDRRSQIFLQFAQFERTSRGLPEKITEVRTPEQMRLQDVTAAKLFVDESLHKYPALTKRQIVRAACQNWEVNPEELGFDQDYLTQPDSDVSDAQELGTNGNGAIG